jgi:hypothetical protein
MGDPIYVDSIYGLFMPYLWDSKATPYRLPSPRLQVIAVPYKDATGRRSTGKLAASNKDWNSCKNQK